MFFGMTNSPATFQTMMNDIFQDLIAEGIMVVYLDDILIFTRTEEEHAKAIRWVLQVLQKHKLFLHPEKCEFCKERIEYLGLVISENEVSMDPVKVAGVRKWPTPENKMDVQAFPGFINFYRRFIWDFFAKARPLFDLTCSEQVWTWSGKEQMAFEDLKTAVTTAPVLVSPQDLESFWVEVDSSNFATGAVLSQQSMTDGKWHPIAFYSKTLSSMERNYKIHDKKMLAIIRALEEWRHFLEGATHLVEIWTDHKNLEYFMTAKKLNRHQARWSLHLARFDFLLHHYPGRTMGKPDTLSRRANHGNGALDNENIVLLRPEFLTIRALEGVELAGIEQKILSDIRKGNRNGDQEEPIAKAARELWSFANEAVHSLEWSNIDGLLWFRGKIYVPWSLDLRRQIVALCHDTQIVEHPRCWKTLELVSRNYWWPQMSRYISQYVSTCDLCLWTKLWRHSPVGELQPLSVPDARWDTLSVDFVVELPESSRHDAVMTVVDAVSKRVHFIPTYTTVTAEGAARLFLHYVWKLHGLPKHVISDCRPQFIALFTKELYRLLGI